MASLLTAEERWILSVSQMGMPIEEIARKLRVSCERAKIRLETAELLDVCDLDEPETEHVGREDLPIPIEESGVEAEDWQENGWYYDDD